MISASTAEDRMIRRVERAKKGHADSLSGLAKRAARLAASGRQEEAVATWRQVERQWPGNAAVAAGLGLALLAAEQVAEALVWLCSACERHPRDAGLLRLQAQALLAAGLRREAIGALYVALALDPNAANTHAGLGIALFQEGCAEAALPHCEAAFRLAPDAANAATLSCVLIDLGRFEDAVAIARKTGREVDFKIPLNRSIALHGLGQAETSLAAAREAVLAAPDNAVARHHLASALLGAGELTGEAWALYDARSGLPGAPAWPDPARRWNGGDVAGKTLLLHAEQGLGDTIQFVRYAPLVAARGARVVLSVQRPLLRLLHGTPGAAEVVASGSNLPAFDLYCPLLSLPGLFGTSLETIPPALPYAVDLPVSLPSAGTLRVGLVWAGNSTFADDRKRSIDPAVVAKLGSLSGVRFHSLQFGAATMPLAGMVDLMQGVADFADTARAVAGLDLVIAVDTAVAHLAATMGKPVWLLSRFQGCWRWLQGRNDSPWYPSIRIYRQDAPNDWGPVIRRVRDDLSALATAPTPLAA